MTKREERAGRTVLIASAAVLFVVVLAGSILEWVDPVPADPSAAVQAHQAAARIDAVLTTGDLDAPPSLIRTITFVCDRGSGEPGLGLGYGVPTAPGADASSASRKSAGRAVISQLRKAKWKRFQPGDVHSAEYQKLFKDWVASLNNLGPDSGNFWGATLLVGSDLTVNCSKYRTEVTKVLRDQQRLHRDG
jgi:hypothetical protein